MDKKNIVIAVLGVVLVVTLIGFIAAANKINRITGEKSEFMAKIRETENLAAELDQNVADLKAMLGKAEKEKQAYAREASEIKKRLEEAARKAKQEAQAQAQAQEAQ